MATVNVGRQAALALLVVDTAGQVRDDFDVSFVSLDSSVASVDAKSVTVTGPL